MSTTINKQILINARALFAGPENWIQGDLANAYKTAWCLEGAISEAGIRLGLEGDPLYDSVEVACQELRNTLDTRCGPQTTCAIHTYNDSPATTFEDITTLLDDTIEMCDA